MAVAVLVPPVLAASLTVATPAVAATGPTCHGHRATLVGHGETVQGTSQRDVIVSNGARVVRAAGGDDLICLTRNRRTVRVSAGDGDDTVDNLDGNPDSQIAYHSGRGSDRYRGNGGYDDVTVVPDGRDRIDTVGGGDYVTVSKSRHVGAPTIDLGRGGDILSVDNGGVGGHLVGGGGHDALTVKHRSAQTWTLDNQRGVAQAGSETRFRWSGFEYFDLDLLRVPKLVFLGSDESETLFLPNFGARALDLRTGAGDDDVEVNALTGGDLDLGPGTDVVDFNSSATGSTLRADLRDGVATASNRGSAHSWTLAGVENLSAHYFAQADLFGDDGSNTLDGSFSDHSTADGRGGSDTCHADVTTNCELS